MYLELDLRLVVQNPAPTVYKLNCPWARHPKLLPVGLVVPCMAAATHCKALWGPVKAPIRHCQCFQRTAFQSFRRVHSIILTQNDGNVLIFACQ